VIAAEQEWGKRDGRPIKGTGRDWRNRRKVQEETGEREERGRQVV